MPRGKSTKESSQSQEHKTFIFILGVTGSGTTLLKEILKTSPHVSSLKGDGMHIPETVGIVPELQYNKHQWDYYNIDWPEIKRRWLELWDNSKRVYLEKSPLDLLYVREIREHFPMCKFIVIVRNPYAVIEKLKRAKKFLGSIENMTEIWIKASKELAFCDSEIFTRYEDLVEFPNKHISAILQRIPELGNINLPHRIDSRTIYGNGVSGLVDNLNNVKIKRLSRKSLNKINKLLREKGSGLMSMFKYEYIEPSFKRDMQCLLSVLILSPIRIFKKLKSSRKSNEGLKPLLGRWQIRLEYTIRVSNIFRFLIILVIFCRVFEMRPLWYVITVSITIVMFILGSWILDKMGMISYAQKAIWGKTPGYHAIIKLLKEIKEKKDAKG